MSENDPYASTDPNVCIWKPTIKKVAGDKTQVLKFPCRFPDVKKTAEICNPCLMGDIFAMQYSQSQGLKKQQNLNDEIMTYLRNMTSDGDLNDFK
ncbi:MAG: hypothetical protein ACW99A_08915 [Candidatus Kariarchaeaceae archaeon]|jgi:hypothetical protein